MNENPSGSPLQDDAGPGLKLSALLYAALTLLFTWPLVWRLGDALPLGGNDVFQNYWNFWWWRHALLGGAESPFATTLIYAPGETSLAFHTHSPGNLLLTLPIWLS